MMHGSSSWGRNMAIAHFYLNTNEYSLKAVLKIRKYGLQNNYLCMCVCEQICACACVCVCKRLRVELAPLVDDLSAFMCRISIFGLFHVLFDF